MLISRVRALLPFTAFVLFASVLAPGCGGSAGSGTIESVCGKCSSDSPDTVQHCIKEATEAQSAAESGGCGAEFEAAIQCLDEKGTCKSDGKLDPAACKSENEAFESCAGPT
jgi:hypothetical protein